MFNSESTAHHHHQAISESRQEGINLNCNLTVKKIVKRKYLNVIEKMHNVSHSQCLTGMIEGAQLPIAILMVQSSTPVLVYNKTESFDSNMLRILMEYGLNLDEAVKNCHRYTLIGHLMDKTNFDARDDPYMMHMCEMVTYQFM